MVSEEQKKEKSLRYSVKDGVFASLMSGFTADYATPFLLFLGGTVKHVGVLAALPNLFSSVIQLKSADIAEKLRSRKRVITLFVLLQALMLPPMVGTYLLGKSGVAAFIAVFTLFTTFGAIVAPLWGSLMADLVRDDKRGEYFGWRNKTLGLVSVASAFGAGFILHQAEKYSLVIGFAVIFGAAFVFRLFSWTYLKKMHEPELVQKKEDYFTLRDFISRARQSNFARFVFFVAITKFCVNIASPFFAVFMLRDLKYGYLTYTMITLGATVTTFLTMRRWGVLADRVGNLKVVKLTSKMVAFIPLLWLINQNPVFIFSAQVFSGFAWAGFNLSASNFIFDSTTPGKRARCIAFFNFFNGLSLSLGALLGGWLAQKLPAGFFGYNLMNLILISATLRLAAAFFMPFRLKEVREVEKIKSHEMVFSVLKLKPVLRFIARPFAG